MAKRGYKAEMSERFPHTHQLMLEGRVQVVKSGVDKYSRFRFERIPKGYDFLENQYILRKSILKRYSDMSDEDIDLFLWLFPKQFVSMEMLREYGYKASYPKILSLQKLGYLEVYKTDRLVRNKLFRCTGKMGKFVKDYYELLCDVDKLWDLTSRTSINLAEAVNRAVRSSEKLEMRR
ncbi:hypothetical protein AB4865_10385 [Capnocytophaga sp. ARDL2]|uniref:hypothetical protein n=1 Tax=Capnocytophaga sp. ARDL2 TaxID=3238809 RepID=UPI003556D81A